DLLRSSARCTKCGTKGARPAASVLDEYGRRLGAVSDPVRRGPLPWAWSPRPTAEHPYQPPAKLSECLAVVAVLAQMHVRELFELLIGDGRLVVEPLVHLEFVQVPIVMHSSILQAATVSARAGRRRETWIRGSRVARRRRGHRIAKLRAVIKRQW